jgi:transcriptional regulator with XRE-family HTH domain
MTADEIRARIEAALFLDEPAGDWWLDETVRRLEAYQSWLERKRVYDVSCFGARLRTARQIHGITQPRLGKLIGVHGFAVSDWELGKQDMPITHLRPICTALRVTEAWLLGDSTEGGPPTPQGIQRRQAIPNYPECTVTGKLLKLHHGGGKQSKDACLDCRLRCGYDPLMWRCGVSGEFCSMVRDMLRGRPCPDFAERPERRGWLYRLWRWIW